MTRGQSIIEKPVLTNRFVEALGYAAELHLHQRRKGKGQPYVGHLLGVAAIGAACCAPTTQNVNRRLAETLLGSPSAVPENKLAKLITLSRFARFTT